MIAMILAIISFSNLTREFSDSKMLDIFFGDFFDCQEFSGHGSFYIFTDYFAVRMRKHDQFSNGSITFAKLVSKELLLIDITGEHMLLDSS